jgi:hypothetical protein
MNEAKLIKGVMMTALACAIEARELARRGRR